MKPYLSNGPYSIRLAKTEEKKEILRLRYSIFTEELQEGSQNQSKQDFDAFDKYCDFLVLIHNKSREIVGLYRILPYFKRKYYPGFYSETEFELYYQKTKFEKNIAELGRLCIKKEHRGKGLLNLLWLGLIKYAKENKIRYYFGCGSLKPDTNLPQMQKIYWYLKNKGLIKEKFTVMPIIPKGVALNLLMLNKNIKIRDLEMPSFIIDIGEKQDVTKKEFDELCPSLIKRYLKIGTKILGRPAYDPYFRCYDFLLLIDSSNIRVKMLNIYLKAQMMFQKLNGKD